MVAVFNCSHTDTHCFGFLHGGLHRGGPRNLAQAVLGIHANHRSLFIDDLGLGTDGYTPLLYPLYILRQTDDTMRVYPP